jgi:hypothetical protein
MQHLLRLFSLVLFLLTRSIERRTSRLPLEGASEPTVPAEPVKPEQEPPPTPTELAVRERERNFSQIRIAFTRTRRRMIEETERIQRNGLLNLAIGILFSVVALGILGYPLLAKTETSTPDGWIQLFEHFAPRFSVGILVQAIGFFFLRLYVAGEREVHYLRNELTNWEARLIAYSAALATKDAKAMRDNIKELSRLERNLKLEKGERSLNETDETYNDMRQLITDAFNALGQRRSKTKSKSEDA